MSSREFRRSFRLQTQRIVVEKTPELPPYDELERRARVEAALVANSTKKTKLPEDDIVVKRMPRFSRVVDSLPKDFDIETLPPFFRECLKYYMSEYSVIQRTYESYYTVDDMLTAGGKKKGDDFVDQTFDFDKEPSDPSLDSTRNSFAQVFPYLSSIQSLAQVWSNTPVPRVMHLYDPDDIMSRGTSTDTERIAPEFPTDPIFGTQVLVECLTLSFDIPELEPIFCTLCLYDTVSRQKLTENFHFDLASDTVLSYLPYRKFSDPETKSRRALFRVANPNSNIILLLRTEKVLFGDPSEAIKPYCGNYSSKTAPRLQEACEKLGAFRQSFCWGATPLYADSEGAVSLREGLITIDQLYHARNDCTEEFILDSITDKVRASKSLHQINGSLRLRIRPVSDNVVLPFTIDPSYLPVQTYRSNTGTNPTPTPSSSNIANSGVSETIREVVNFPLTWNYFHTSFFNYLYIYPISVNFSNRTAPGSCRNVCVRVELRSNDMAEETTTLGTFIFGRSSDQNFKTSESTHVIYHEKAPSFQDEIKIRLPFPLHEKHHIFFTFLHVKCKSSEKEPKGAIESPVGYAWLPLYSAGMIDDETQELPVATEYKPFYFEERVKSRIMWVDKQKPVFSFKTRVVSSIFPQDRKLLSFFDQSQALIQNPLSGDASVETTFAALAQSYSTCTRFLPLIINQTFILMDSVPREMSSRLFAHLVNMIATICSRLGVTTEKKPQFLSEYVHYHFDNCQGKIPELFLLLSTAWVDFAEEHNEEKPTPITQNFLRLSWFFYEIIIKSLCLYKATKTDPASAEYTFSTFGKNLITLTSNFSMRMGQNNRDNVNLVRHLNSHFAFFIRDLLPHVDFSVVREITEEYMMRVTTKQYQVTFILVIAEHEHYIPFNSPETAMFTQDMDVYDHFANRFPLAHLAIQPLMSLMDQFNSDSKPRPGNRVAVASMLRKIIAKHDLDFRYQDWKIKSNIAYMYFPVLDLFIENVELFGKGDVNSSEGIADREEQRNFLISLAFLIIHIPKDIFSSWWRNQEITKVCCFVKLLNIMFYAFEHPFVLNPRRENAKDSIDVYDPGQIIQNEKQNLAKEKAVSTAVHVSTIEIVARIVDDFKAVWSKASEEDESLAILEEIIIFTSSALRCHITESTFVCLMTFTQQLISIHSKYIFEYGTNNLTLTSQIHEGFALQDILSEILRYTSFPRKDIRDFALTTLHHIISVNYWQSKEFSTIKSMIILSSADLVTKIKGDKRLTDALQELSVFAKISPKFLIQASDDELELDLRQRMTFLGNDANRLLFKVQNMVYAASTPDEMVTIARIMKSVKEQLKQMEGTLSPDEREFVIRQIDEVSAGRAGRAALLDPEIETLKKLKNAVTSTILGVQDSLFKTMSALDNWISSPHSRRVIEVWRRVRLILRESVYLMPNWKASSVESSEFKGLVREYVEFINTIQNLIEDAIRFRDLDNDDDFETTTDIHLRIANQYNDSLDIKVSKLENLANLLHKKQLYAEAAMCFFYVAEIKLKVLKNPEQYITLVKDEETPDPSQPLRENRSNSLRRASSKGSIRRRLSQGTISARRSSLGNVAPPDETDMQNLLSEGLLGHAFSREGTIRSLKDSISFFEKAELFEACPDILHQLLALYSQKKDYMNLCQTHAQFTDIYQKIMDAQKTFRAFGTYYRVGFYGKAFRELDTKEFVYKEPKITMLPEITERLKRQVEKKYKQVPTVFPDSRAVDLRTLQEDKLYLQITSVEVFFSENEDRRRQGAYERCNRITQFIFETPFTASGSTQAESVIDQYKRKTIISVENPFPYLLTRQLVVDKYEIELTPLANSIETIQRRIAQIQKELASHDISVKNLQSLLQGSVLVQVNAGILAIAHGFLDSPHKYPFEEVTQLRESLRTFLSCCKAALQKNRLLIKSDQDAFQAELEKGYRFLEQELNPLLL